MSLFDQTTPPPPPKRPPTWAYVLAVILGTFYPLGLLLAPLLAWRWPSEGWKWGLWSTLSILPLYACALAVRGGLAFGAGGAVPSPFALAYVPLACLLAFAVSKAKGARSS